MKIIARLLPRFVFKGTIAHNTTDQNLARLMREEFASPTPLLEAVIARLEHADIRSSSTHDGRPVPLNHCPHCGNHVQVEQVDER